MLPIGQLLRKRARTKASGNEKEEGNKPKSTKLTDIDELINSLSKGDSNSDSESDDSDDVSSDGNVQENVLVEADESGHVVKLVSSNFDDAIAPLPATLLPVPMARYKNSKATDREVKLKDGAKKVVKFSDESHSTKPEKQAPIADQSGLEKTIRDMLKHYQPSSNEKRPFWCRICRYQGANLEDWKQHNSTPEHKLAEDIERRMSYCRICKKQFTSPDQLTEHNKGKAHRLVLDKLKARQTKNKQMSISY